jgi:hypothetical protein
VTDDERNERGYREERPLSEIIPPDRRWLKATAFVVLGMIAGAALLAFAQHTSAQRAAPHAPTERASRPAVIRSITLRTERRDVTSPRLGAIGPDGQVDWMFDLHVEGSVAGIVLVYCDENGVPKGGRRWATIDFDPAAPNAASFGPPREGAWQLGVSDGAHVANDVGGGIPILEDGSHHLVLHASTALLMLPSEDRLYTGGHVRAYVVGPNHEITPSAVLFIAPDPPPPPDPNRPTSPPFDRGAAAQSLGAVSVAHCGKLAGAEPTGRIELTFRPDGVTSDVAVIEGMDPKSPAARCVSETFQKKTRVPPFGGSPVRVKKSFSLPTSGRATP